MQRCCSASRSSTWSSPGRAPGRSTRSCARRGSPPQVRQAALLPALRVEALRIETGLDGGLGLGPLAVEDREPRSVAVAALGDRGLVEAALHAAAEAQRRLACGGVARARVGAGKGGTVRGGHGGRRIGKKKNKPIPKSLQ